MLCLRLLLLVVLLPWSSSVKRGHTPAGTPLITEWFGEVSSAPADAVTSATPTSPLPPCRLIDETDELPATETPATPIQDVTRVTFRRSLHLSEGGTTAWTPRGTEAEQHVEKNCMVKVEGDTKVKRRLFSWYHPYGGCPTRKTMLERARDDARSDVAYIAQRNSWDSLWLNELPAPVTARATPEFQFKERFLVSLQSGLPLLPQVVEAPKDSGSARGQIYRR